jgi:hypothetical protein
MRIDADRQAIRNAFTSGPETATREGYAPKSLLRTDRLSIGIFQGPAFVRIFKRSMRVTPSDYARKGMLDSFFLAMSTPLTASWVWASLAGRKPSLLKARAIAPAWLEALVQGLSPYARKIDRDRQITFLRIAAGVEDPSAAEALR